MHKLYCSVQCRLCLAGMYSIIGLFSCHIMGALLQIWYNHKSYVIPTNVVLDI